MAQNEQSQEEKPKTLSLPPELDGFHQTETEAETETPCSFFSDGIIHY